MQHAWNDPRLSNEAREFLRNRPEDLGDVWAKIIRDAICGNTDELERVRSKRAVDTPTPDGVRVVTADAKGVLIRLYLPESLTPSKKVVMYFHGGGWVIGGVKSCARFCGELAAAAGVIVAAVEYRLAPEHPFPAGLDDCCSAFLWMREHAKEYGADPAEIYCAGDSAGGNLAAAAALRIHDTFGEQYVAGLLLLYPVVTLIPEEYGESWREFGRGYALDADLMNAFCEAYVHAGLRDDAYVSPLRSTKLACLPRTLCITAKCDILRDQGRMFCERLRSADVSVTERCFEGAVHLFVTVEGMDCEFRRAVGECTNFLQRRSSVE